MLRGLLLLGIWMAAASSARAHPLSPAALVIREHAATRYEVTFRRSELALPHLTVRWPGGCTATPERRAREGDQWVDTLALACPGGLLGRSLHISGLTEVAISAVVYAEFRDGGRARGLLTAARSSFKLPAQTTRAKVFREYLEFGAHHLLTGFDHLLFIAGLLFVVRGVRALIATLTAFTFGHSITLGLAAVGLVKLPEAPVELGIALSLVVLALAMLDSNAAPKRPAWMAGGFGLLHGLGFAGALRSSGLPEHAIPHSLLAFNLGVELAQVALVLPVLGLARLWPSRPRVPWRAFAAYGIGGLSAFWCIERALALWG